MAPEDGALLEIWASTVDKSKLENGMFYEPIEQPGTHSKISNNKKLAGDL